MTDIYLAVIAALLSGLLGLVAWIGVRILEGFRILGIQFDRVAKLHLRHHPEDLEHFKIGGSA